ncbi:MAG: SRPBCC family protein [Gemmatimonadota bacterium]|nr:MAG: SRPBCC family protein [Gemmatimonadota bacterium]
MIWALVFLALGLIGASALVRWGTRWGSTADERARELPGDEYLKGGPRARVAMTRAISIDAPPEHVWPWIAQLGRGAGWYSVDWLDNGRRVSACHIVSWIPELRRGDATAIGYLRHINTGRSVAWWIDDSPFLGSRFRMVTCFYLSAEGKGTRLISRISADATGPLAQVFLLVFRPIDSIMACRQLMGLRKRVQYCEQDHPSPRDPETGARDQYQLYEIIYADGGVAGVTGKEGGAKWRQSAMRDGVIKEGE